MFPLNNSRYVIHFFNWSLEAFYVLLIPSISTAIATATTIAAVAVVAVATIVVAVAQLDVCVLNQYMNFATSEGLWQNVVATV